MKRDYEGQLVFGDYLSLKFPDIRLTGDEKPRKTAPRKHSDGDRIRTHCVRGANAT